MADTKKFSTKEIEKNNDEEKKSTKKVEKGVAKEKKSTEVVEKEILVENDLNKSLEKEDKVEDISTEMVEKDESLNSKKSKNASFSQRLGAYILDILLISIVVSLFVAPFTTSDNYKKLTKESNEVIEEYSEGKIDMNTYMSRVSDISYDMARETGLSSIITIAIYILYFIVYQYYQQGQTLGKKIMKIKVESIDDKELSINMLLMRSFIINSILVDLIILTISIFGNRDVYYMGTLCFEIIQYSVLFIIAMMVLSRKDKRGLHDVICHTKVVNVEV